MGQAPCNLCWFQRVFVFPLAILLGIAAFRSDRHIIPYGLALAAGGGLVALYHLLLYSGFIPAPIVPCDGGPSCSGESMSVAGAPLPLLSLAAFRSEEHTSELQSLMRISYAVFCLKKKKK